MDSGIWYRGIWYDHGYDWSSSMNHTIAPSSSSPLLCMSNNDDNSTNNSSTMVPSILLGTSNNSNSTTILCMYPNGTNITSTIAL